MSKKQIFITNVFKQNFTVDEYKKFMYNESNVYNCDNCPECKNSERDYYPNLPCNQQNCWVACHIKEG